MSGFQSFKSFMKIQQPNNTTVPNLTAKQPEPKQNNDKQHEKVDKDLPASTTPESDQKNLKRFKKTGTVCNFIAKIYSMLEQKQIEPIIAWANRQPSYSSKYISLEKIPDMLSDPNSSSFQIFDVQKFQEIVLPKYFKHSNMSSFVRQVIFALFQLNMYGFHKLRGEKNNFEFHHQKFQKNRKDLLSEIRRKSPEFMGISSSHLDDPSLKGTLQNLKAIDEKMINQHQRSLNTQQQIELYRDQLNENNLFPSEGFIPLKKISVDDKIEPESQSSLGKDKVKKIEMIEQENNRLKKIKAAKTQKIKDLNSVNKEKIQTKFSKILLSFITLKIKSEFQKPKIDSNLQSTQQMIKNTTIQSLTEHIMNTSEIQSFDSYKAMIQELLG